MAERFGLAWSDRSHSSVQTQTDSVFSPGDWSGVIALEKQAGKTKAERGTGIIIIIIIISSSSSSSSSSSTCSNEVRVFTCLEPVLEYVKYCLNL